MEGSDEEDMMNQEDEQDEQSFDYGEEKVQDIILADIGFLRKVIDIGRF